MPLAPGFRLGAYEILAPLGHGGMGEVYRAKDLRLGREIALKVLPADVASNPDRLARLEREARTVAGLNHPNIVTLHSVEDDGGIRFLTMELVDGQPLSDRIVPGGLPVDELLEIAIPLAGALVAAHERGIVHRDLKPGNVMVTRDRRVKVLDFGLARHEVGEIASLDATAEAPISRTGLALGTIPYMAPEQLRGDPVDARADLFAMGIVLYELASGRRPFEGETSIDVSHAILRKPPEPLHRVRPNLPADLERIVSRCLEKEPRERVQTALDLENELRRLRKLVERGEARPAPREKLASVAVLPFVRRGSGTDQDFSEGLADEILDVLAKIRGLRVPARTSSFRFKDRELPFAEIGRALGVETILDGTVRTAGNRVRISVQLIDVAGGDPLWSEAYDRTLEDVFAVQDDIARAVVRELRTRLLGEQADSDASGLARADVAHAARARATLPEAQRLYQLARRLVDRRNREDTQDGIALLEQAIQLDHGFAAAWAELGRATLGAMNLSLVPVPDALPKARNFVERALALDPDLAEGHSGLGAIRMSHDWDWAGAAASFKRALELEPWNALALRRAGTLALSRGPLDEAIRLYRLAAEQDPLSANSYHNLGIALFWSERLEEAEAAFLKVREINPTSGGTSALLAQVLLAQGRAEEAMAEAYREPPGTFRDWAVAIVAHALGRRAESDAALQTLALAESGVLPAEAYAFRGEIDRAFDRLEAAFAVRASSLTQIPLSRNLRSLHSDPRWPAFLARMGHHPA